MESAFNSKTGKWFDVPDEDYDKFANAFAILDVRSPEYALFALDTDVNKCTREYSDDEIIGIFDLHAEYTGIDVEIKKDEVASLSERRKAREELNRSLTTNEKMSDESARVLIKIVDAFDSYEFTHRD